MSLHCREEEFAQQQQRRRTARRKPSRDFPKIVACDVMFVIIASHHQRIISVVVKVEGELWEEEAECELYTQSTHTDWKWFQGRLCERALGILLGEGNLHSTGLGLRFCS